MQSGEEPWTEDADLALYLKHAPLLEWTNSAKLYFCAIPSYWLTYVFPYIGLQLDKILLSAEVSPANYGAASVRHWTLEDNTEDNTSRAKEYYSRSSQLPAGAVRERKSQLYEDLRFAVYRL